MTARDPTRRFSDRVEHYVRYRPSYPAGVAEAVRSLDGLRPGDPVADVGAGTGIFSELLLDAGFAVTAVEPNGAMRAVAERRLGPRAGFASCDGAAERSGLPAASMSAVTAAQACHWFKIDEARQEFERVLRPPGWVVLVWNDRNLDASRFMRRYEALLEEHGKDYVETNHQVRAAGAVGEMFRNRQVRSFEFDYSQRFDAAGLRGRLLSASYAPNEGQPGHEAMMVALERLFAECRRDGRVEFVYRTRMYAARLTD